MCLNGEVVVVLNLVVLGRGKCLFGKEEFFRLG